MLRSLSGFGLFLGVLLFSAALSPSLIPRAFPVQGAISGACFALGYGAGAAFGWLWRYLELPWPPPPARRILNAGAALLGLVVLAGFLSHAAEWQNSTRVLMNLPPVESAHPLWVCVVGAAVALALLIVARGFALASRALSARLQRVLPRRVSNVVGIAAAALLFWTLANGVLLQLTLQMLDSSYRRLDALIEPERARPESPLKVGSGASLLAWDQLGRAGREFIVSGPSADRIAAVTGRKAVEPLRVYVGLRSAETAAERAQLALAELKRVRAFDRSTLVVITPTGTGWVDPSAANSLEYLLGGDVASVALQYSYLSSPLTLFVDPDYGAESARALFSEIYGYWVTLPKDRRPKFYLQGLSLGSLNSETSVEPFQLLGEPIQGALWSGPPFANRLWRAFTSGRNPNSPFWLPTYRDGSLTRFLNQDGPREAPQTPWGPMRIVYLQYASDAITFFDPRDFFREPDWLKPPRGPDVSPQMRWYPGVTMIQVLFDTLLAMGAPMGFGHVYAPEHYLEAWRAVLGPGDLSAGEFETLKRRLTEERKGASAGAAADGYEGRGG